MSTFFTPGRKKEIGLDELSPETMEAVLLLAYYDAVIVKSKAAAEKVREAVDRVGLTAWIETRRLNDLSDREKDALAWDIRKAEEFQGNVLSGEKETTLLMGEFLRSRLDTKVPADEEKSRLPPSLPTLSIRITDPKLLQTVKERERTGPAPPEILQRVTPTLGARKCYDSQPSYAPAAPSSPTVDTPTTSNVGKVEGVSPPGKDVILRKILGPVSERMETDYREALRRANNAANFVEVSPEGSKKSSVDADFDSATCNEDSGIEGSSRPTSPDFEDEVEEAVEVIDKRTLVRYNENDDSDEASEPTWNKEVEEKRLRMNEKILEVKNKLKRDQGRKRKSPGKKCHTDDNKKGKREQ